MACLDACLTSSHHRRWLPGEHIPEPFHVHCHDVQVRDVVPRERADLGDFVAEGERAAIGPASTFSTTKWMAAMPIRIRHQPMRAALDAQRSDDPHLSARCFQDVPDADFVHTFARLRPPGRHQWPLSVRLLKRTFARVGSNMTAEHSNATVPSVPIRSPDDLGHGSRTCYANQHSRMRSSRNVFLR